MKSVKDQETPLDSNNNLFTLSHLLTSIKKSLNYKKKYQKELKNKKLQMMKTMTNQKLFKKKKIDLYLGKKDKPMSLNQIG